jgi:PadR family transcriptional regulator PadR
MASDEPRLTTPTLQVLGVLASSIPSELSGADIARETKLASGTLYPILFRLEQAKWVESRWESDDPHLLGRPRRRYYSITALGAKRALAGFREVKTAFGRLAWS